MLPAAMVSTVIKTVAQVEHLRWTKVKEVWTKLEAGYDAGNIPDALDEYLDVQDGSGAPKRSWSHSQPPQHTSSKCGQKWK